MGAAEHFHGSRPLLPPLAARGFSGREDVLPGRRSPFAARELYFLAWARASATTRLKPS
jgi:hypothetical protein